MFGLGLGRATHTVENCADLENPHGSNIAAPGDVLIGTDQQRVGAVVLADAGAAQVDHGQRDSPGPRGVDHRSRHARVAREHDQGEPVTERVVDRSARSEPDVGQAGADEVGLAGGVAGHHR